MQGDCPLFFSLFLFPLLRITVLCIVNHPCFLPSPLLFSFILFRRLHKMRWYTGSHTLLHHLPALFHYPSQTIPSSTVNSPCVLFSSVPSPSSMTFVKYDVTVGHIFYNTALLHLCVPGVASPSHGEGSPTMGRPVTVRAATSPSLPNLNDHMYGRSPLCYISPPQSPS